MVKAAEDLWKTTLDVVRERLSSPIVVPFLASWVVFNYKFLVVLFSAASLSTTFAQIQQLYPGSSERWLRGLICPLGTSIVVMVILPWLEYAHLQATRHAHEWLSNLRLKIAKATPVDPEVHLALRLELQELSAKFDQQVSMIRSHADAQVGIARNEARIASEHAASAKAELVNAASVIENDVFRLTAAHIDLLRQFSPDDKRSRGIQASRFDGEQRKLIEDLLTRGFLQQYLHQGESFFVITVAGLARSANERVLIPGGEGVDDLDVIARIAGFSGGQANTLRRALRLKSISEQSSMSASEQAELRALQQAGFLDATISEHVGHPPTYSLSRAAMTLLADVRIS